LCSRQQQQQQQQPAAGHGRVVVAESIATVNCRPTPANNISTLCCQSPDLAEEAIRLPCNGKTAVAIAILPASSSAAETQTWTYGIAGTC